MGTSTRRRRRGEPTTNSPGSSVATANSRTAYKTSASSSPAAITERYTTCGKANCRCHADPPQRHGPYIEYTRKVAGKTIGRLVTAEQADQYRHGSPTGAPSTRSPLPSTTSHTRPPSSSPATPAGPTPRRPPRRRRWGAKSAFEKCGTSAHTRREVEYAAAEQVCGLHVNLERIVVEKVEGEAFGHSQQYNNRLRSNRAMRPSARAIATPEQHERALRVAPSAADSNERSRRRAPTEVFRLRDDVTTIGSDATCGIRLAGLAPFEAEVRHDEADEFVVVRLGDPGATRVNGAPVDTALLRTASRLEIGDWTMSFYREEYADHGRPYGGRVGGEAGHQRRQPPRDLPRPRAGEAERLVGPRPGRRRVGLRRPTPVLGPRRGRPRRTSHDPQPGGLSGRG